ncbi:hypothetical protein KJ780_01410, partial [Candidatus Micrarchaeota archaeon]|nr:hypothetical protein [Candidatus Micrarchaeota archaeon]
KAQKLRAAAELKERQEVLRQAQEAKDLAQKEAERKSKLEKLEAEQKAAELKARDEAEAKALKTITTTYLMNFSINGINFTVLNPQDGQKRFFSINNDGIVLMIKDRNFSLMTTGDISYSAQTRIGEGKDFNPKCTVLQIPNYGLGQRTSHIDLFLLKTSPQAAIITGNYYDPAKEKYVVEELLKLKSIPYYQTYNSTNKTLNVVRISTNGYEYAIIK